MEFPKLLNVSIDENFWYDSYLVVEKKRSKPVSVENPSQQKVVDSGRAFVFWPWIRKRQLQQRRYIIVSLGNAVHLRSAVAHVNYSPYHFPMVNKLQWNALKLICCNASNFLIRKISNMNLFLFCFLLI